MTAITTRIYTTFFGQLVGTDQFGNEYYRSKKVVPNRLGDKRGHERRWVLYNGKAEPTKVPPEWHGWLHYTFATPPTERPMPKHTWQKAPLPNLTGTNAAYFPPGHLLKGGVRAPNTSDYEPWQPN